MQTRARLFCCHPSPSLFFIVSSQTACYSVRLAVAKETSYGALPHGWGGLSPRTRPVQLELWALRGLCVHVRTRANRLSRRFWPVACVERRPGRHMWHLVDILVHADGSNAYDALSFTRLGGARPHDQKTASVFGTLLSPRVGCSGGALPAALRAPLRRSDLPCDGDLNRSHLSPCCWLLQHRREHQRFG